MSIPIELSKEAATKILAAAQRIIEARGIEELHSPRKTYTEGEMSFERTEVNEIVIKVRGETAFKVQLGVGPLSAEFGLGRWIEEVDRIDRAILQEKGDNERR